MYLFFVENKHTKQKANRFLFISFPIRAYSSGPTFLVLAEISLDRGVPPLLKYTLGGTYFMHQGGVFPEVKIVSAKKNFIYFKNDRCKLFLLVCYVPTFQFWFAEEWGGGPPILWVIGPPFNTGLT